MKKKLFTLLICAFAVLSANAWQTSADGTTFTIYGTDQVSNLGKSAIPSTVTTIKLSGSFSGWSGGALLEGISGVTTIDLSDADFSATTATITPTTTQVQNDDGSYSTKITGYSYSITNSWAFKNFTGLTNIIWPESSESTERTITVLPENAFYGCTSLASVTIPNTVEVIGNHAFSGCSSLATLNYEETSSVKYFGQNAFKGTALTSVTIPGSALFIDTNAFCEIDALKTVSFAKECTADLIVKFHAFDNSSNVTDVYIKTEAHIQCEGDAFEDDYTFAHGQVSAPKANLHFPDSQADYFTNLTHFLDEKTAADPGLFQAWLVEHYRQAQTLAQQNNNGWWEFINAGGGDPDKDPEYPTGKFLMTYSHPTHAHIVPDGVKAYIVNDVQFNSTHKLFEVILKSITVIPANTGVILYGQTNANNSEGKPSLSMTIVRLAASITDDEGTHLYPEGQKLPDGTLVDLSLRRSNWDAPFDFVDGYQNYLEPTAKEDGTTTTLNPYDTDSDGKVAFRYFGFSHFKKTKDVYKSAYKTYADYAGFFRCAKNSKIPSGKAYLKLAKNEFGFTGDELELLIKKDDGYYLRAAAKSQASADTQYIDERLAANGGYWNIATWDPAEDFGVRNTAIPAAKFMGEPFFEEDEATGVAKIIIPVSTVDTYYNLNGQQVANPTKGVYIKNGKKVIVK